LFYILREVVGINGDTSRRSFTTTKLHPAERGNGIFSSKEDYMVVSLPATKCEICGTPTNISFGSPGNLHYHCEEHKDALFAQVTGKAPKKTPKRKN